MLRIEIDPNTRSLGNSTFVGIEDLDFHPLCDQDVIVYESESGIEGPGKILHVDKQNGLVYLWVDWAELHIPDTIK